MNTEIVEDNTHMEKQAVAWMKSHSNNNNGSLKLKEDVESEEENPSNPWEAQEGWTYIGHGDWVQVENLQEAVGQEDKPQTASQWVMTWLGKNDLDIKLHKDVLEKGYPNRWWLRSL